MVVVVGGFNFIVSKSPNLKLKNLDSGFELWLDNIVTIDYVCRIANASNVFVLFECSPKLFCANFLISNILTNRSILIHLQFMWKYFILTWTINLKPGSIRFKLVFEEMNLKNTSKQLFGLFIILP